MKKNRINWSSEPTNRNNHQEGVFGDYSFTVIKFGYSKTYEIWCNIRNQQCDTIKHESLIEVKKLAEDWKDIPLYGRCQRYS